MNKIITLFLAFFLLLFISGCAEKFESSNDFIVPICEGEVLGTQDYENHEVYRCGNEFRIVPTGVQQGVLTERIIAGDGFVITDCEEGTEKELCTQNCEDIDLCFLK